jgi:uncharacterized protein
MANRRERRPRRVPFAPRLIIMAKSPIAGAVKRRLAREIGDVPAIRFYRHCLAHAVRRLVSDPRWRTFLAVAPDRDVSARFWSSLGKVERLPQGQGDLGKRMQRLFRGVPPGPVIIVGSDIPALRPSHIAEAFRLLGRADAVLGPAPDGGYWLIGFKRSPRLPAPFAGVRWSSAHALADTRSNLEGNSVALASALQDVDTSEAYRNERDEAGRLILPYRPSASRALRAEA